MKTLTVALPGREYDILIEAGLLEQTGAQCRRVLPRTVRTLVVTDSNVGPLYGAQVTRSLEAAGFSVHTVTIHAGEPSKCAAWLERIWDEAMAFGLTRTDAVVALGGGVVGDLAGFAAATILRGVPFVQIPTTLLAQVDSSVGGKVAIDLPAGKNLVGAFWQPKLVLMDTTTLDTLSDRIFSDGMAEIIKYGCIWDREFFDLLARCGDRAGVMAHIEEVLCTCCAIKAKVVMEDERDTGLRMILNFGHTLGHAYEKAYHYETYTHGQAVSAGMVLAAELGERLGVTQPGTKARIEQLTATFGLPTAIPCTAEDYEGAVGLDKKGSGDSITVILLRTLGECAPTKMEKKELLALL
ncbi:MAG: 3-dehydroquinate synthase [Clostridiales bacterium]|nr:3-dehydroquinate synthase [Clostridiales bacterium]